MIPRFHSWTIMGDMQAIVLYVNLGLLVHTCITLPVSMLNIIAYFHAYSPSFIRAFCRSSQSASNNLESSTDFVISLFSPFSRSFGICSTVWVPAQIPLGIPWWPLQCEIKIFLFPILLDAFLSTWRSFLLSHGCLVSWPRWPCGTRSKLLFCVDPVMYYLNIGVE